VHVRACHSSCRSHLHCLHEILLYQTVIDGHQLQISLQFSRDDWTCSSTRRYSIKVLKEHTHYTKIQ